MRIPTPAAVLGSLLFASACASPPGMPSHAVATAASGSLWRDHNLYRLEHVDATEVAASMNELFQGMIPAPGDQSPSADVHFQADLETNTIIYWAPESRDPQIRALLEELDRAFG